MKPVIRGLITILLGVTYPVAIAHHSFRATFKADETISVEGIVTEFSFRNPHILIYMDVTDDEGKTTNWMSEGSAATNMRRNGWSKDSLKPGELIRVTGKSTHDGSPMVSIDQVDILNPANKSIVSVLLPRQDRGSENAASTSAAKPDLPLITLLIQ